MDVTTHQGDLVRATRTPPKLLEPALLSRAARDALGKLDPRHLVRNPVIFVTEVVSILVTLLTILAELPTEIGGPLGDDGVAPPPWNGAPVQFVDVFPRTIDRKIHLCPPALDREAPLGMYRYQPDPATDAFPLALISPASERTVSSTLGELPRPEVKLLLHPDDAAAREVADDDEVRVWNSQGEVVVRAQIGVWTRRGTVVLPKGLWRKHTKNGYTANVLAPATLTDLGAGACFNDARVQVARRA